MKDFLVNIEFHFKVQSSEKGPALDIETCASLRNQLLPTLSVVTLPIEVHDLHLVNHRVGAKQDVALGWIRLHVLLSPVPCDEAESYTQGCGRLN